MTTTPKSDEAAESGSFPAPCPPSSATPRTDEVANDPNTSWNRKSANLANLAKSLECERNEAFWAIEKWKRAFDSAAACNQELMRQEESEDFNCKVWNELSETHGRALADAESALAYVWGKFKDNVKEHAPPPMESQSLAKV
jgi:exonuclease VII small subunit